jgi:long-chain acyl-CoA synthetase
MESRMTSAIAATPTAANPMTGARPALFTPSAPLGVSVDALSPDTMPGIALRQARRYGDRLNLSVKLGGVWLPVTWNEMHASTVAVGAALVHAGVAAGERVAILSENRLEWLASDFGSQSAGAVVVPIYASSTAEMVGTILNDCEAVAVICSTTKQASKVTELAASLPRLRLRVLMEDAADGFTSLSDLVAAATPEDVATLAARASTIVPGDPVTIIYTSGTTGVPKGVVPLV